MQRLSLDLVRRSNLSLVLRLVHRERALSRAAITRATGLSRSTVGALLADLAAVDLVREELPVAVSQVGRPSATVVVSPSALVGAVQIGPHRVDVALGGLGGVLFARRSAEVEETVSPTGAAELVGALLTEAAGDLEHPARVIGVTAGLVGRVDPDDRVVVTSAELGWTNVAFADLLTEATGRPATVCYRTQLAATAERIWGSARDIDNLVYLHGAPAGIGGVVIADGERLRGGAGLAARIGHLFVGDTDRACSCGAFGCLMALVTERDLLDRIGGAAAGLDPFPDDRLRAQLRADPDGDLARLVEADLGYLDIALRSIMVAYDPDAIVLGGFLAGLLRVGRERLAMHLAATEVTSIRAEPRLIEPTLGADQVLLGATHRAYADLLADPLSSGLASIPLVG